MEVLHWSIYWIILEEYWRFKAQHLQFPWQSPKRRTHVQPGNSMFVPKWYTSRFTSLTCQPTAQVGFICTQLALKMMLPSHHPSPIHLRHDFLNTSDPWGSWQQRARLERIGVAPKIILRNQETWFLRLVAVFNLMSVREHLGTWSRTWWGISSQIINFQKEMVHPWWSQG